VELDSLEALHPGELAGIVEAEILNYYDRNYQAALRAACQKYQDALDDESRAWMAAHQDEIDGLNDDYKNLVAEWQRTIAEFNIFAEPFQEKIETYRDDLDAISKGVRLLHDEIRDDLDEVEIEAPQIPAPDLPPENDGMLYASYRDYFEQLAAYQNYKNGNGAT